MPIVKRTGIDHRIILRNSRVYAAPLNAFMNGLFAYRSIKQGEILVQYTGEILSQRLANESDSQYLFDVLYRTRPGSDRVRETTIDGAPMRNGKRRVELMAYANHAPDSIANAKAMDILGSIIDEGIPFLGRHALVLVAKTDIPEGTEIRFSYNEQEDGDMVQMMLARGVTRAQLSDRSFRTLRFVRPPDRNHSGLVERDFPIKFIDDVVK